MLIENDPFTVVWFSPDSIPISDDFSQKVFNI